MHVKLAVHLCSKSVTHTVHQMLPHSCAVLQSFKIMFQIDALACFPFQGRFVQPWKIVLLTERNWLPPEVFLTLDKASLERADLVLSA